MKKIIVMLMLLAPMAVFAQKFGHVDTQAIIQSLPEVSKVNGELEALGKQYQNELQTMQDEINRKADEYEKTKSTMNATKQQETDDKHVNVYVKVDEGQKYYIRDIKWVGNTVYTTDRLNELLTMKSGDVYNQTLLEKRLRGDDDAVGNLYWNNGYVFSSIDPTEVNIVVVRHGQSSLWVGVRRVSLLV